MYPAVWEPLLERRVDHPAWRSLCSVLCMVWSSWVLLTKGVSLTNKRKNHSKTDLPWRRAACVFLLKALTSPVIGRFNSACLTGKKKSGRVKVAQLYPALCDAMDCILPGSSVHGISQARLLEWVAMPFSRGSSWPGMNSGPLHCRQILYHLSQPSGMLPQILEWRIGYHCGDTW